MAKGLRKIVDKEYIENNNFKQHSSLKDIWYNSENVLYRKVNNNEFRLVNTSKSFVFL
ncbi:MAG: hypothetical protein QW041_03380 [Candidatus Pacearchaeota archaeon]